MSGNHTYAGPGEGEALWVVDIPNSANPTRVGHHRPPEEIRSLAVGPARDDVYVATSVGLWVIGASDPASPNDARFCGACKIGDDVAVAPAGDYVYVAIWGDGLRVVDVSDPTKPTVAAQKLRNGCGAKMVLTDDKIYVVGGWRKERASLLVVDVSEPADPTEVTRYEGKWRFIGDVAATEDYVMIEAGDAGLLILRFGGNE